MVRKCETKVLVRLSKQNKDRLEQDRFEFEQTIGGGKWSLNDAFSEYLKILNTIKVKK